MIDGSDFHLGPRAILENLNDGVYVTDTERRIVYWSRSAERITGWKKEDLLGHRCCDDILCHQDKSGQKLCDADFCPLHRSIVTGSGATYPVTVFANGKDGQSIPLQVSVAPIRDDEGRIVGGVETFRDLSGLMKDYNRAHHIQAQSLPAELPNNEHLACRAHYVPHDLLGGDYYNVLEFDASRYGILLADITGHGVSAALYTMCISSLWDQYHHLLTDPAKFLTHFNHGLCRLVRDSESFASAICGYLDLEHGTLRLAGAGNPAPLMLRANGQWDQPYCPGLPLGYMTDIEFETTNVSVAVGDTLLWFTDGAVDVRNSEAKALNSQGLGGLLRRIGYPEGDADLNDIEGALLSYSNDIRIGDDLTLLETKILSTSALHRPTMDSAPSGE